MVIQLVRLVYNSEVVGCRAYIDSDVLDMDLNAFKKLHIKLSSIPRWAELKSVGLLLLTDDEVKSGVHAKDISADESQINRIRENLPQYLSSLDPNPSSKPVNEPKLIPVHLKPKRLPKDSITFNRGFSIILVSVHEDASEYQVIRLEHVVDIIFSDKSAIIAAGRLLWGQFNMKKALKEYSSGKRIFRVRLTGDMLWKLNMEFGSKLHVLKEGYLYTYLNHYNDMHYSVQLTPPHFEVNLSSFDFKPFTGPAKGGISLEAYLVDLKDEDNQGLYSYHPNLSVVEVRAQWVKLNI